MKFSDGQSGFMRVFNFMIRKIRENQMHTEN